ncbi:FecR family protein [Halioxenophilus aromaticivorans]|uniref:FecR domain-containing protein n=1 Tax=Halioxenophilus aromaticivorans TaxID=1306992 RepID=A0AAV3TZ37_9ALTE
MFKHVAAVVLVANLLMACGASAEQSWLYSVRPGDNLWNLCQKYTHKIDCWLTLGEYNSVDLPDQLPPGLIIRFPISWLKAIPTPVTLSFFSGDVTYQTTAQSSPESVQVGMKLPIGSVVNTGDESIAGLLFGDGSLMQVEPNSSVELDALSLPDGSGYVDSRIRLQSGAVKTRVPERQPKSRFQITTPAAIAAVRGTEFRVTAYDDAGTSAMTGEVFDGAVGVAGTSAAKEPKNVAAGFGIKAQQGKELAEPKPLPPAPEWGEIAALQKPPISAQWQPVAEAVSYRLEILAPAADGGDAELISVTGTPDLQFLDEDMAYTSGCFVLALRAVDAEGLMGLANEQQVCTRDKLATPAQIKKRAINFNSKADWVLLDWQPVASATRYLVQLSADENFNTILAEHQSQEPKLSLSVTEAMLDGFYYRVQAQGEDVVFSDHSLPRAVQVQDEPLKALAAISAFWVLLIAL